MEKEPAEIVGELCDATKKLLQALDTDETCGVCEQTFKFHAFWCPVHEVNLALDKVEQMDAYYWVEDE